MKTCITRQGDKWDSIAHEQLGSCDYTDRLMQLNPDCIGYYLFPAGIVLRLPEPEAVVSSKLPPWKRGNA